MSILYKALEKAERERKAALKSVRSEKGPIIPIRSIRERRVHRSISLTGPNTIAAEEFRKLRTLIFQTSISKPMQTLLVTSAIPGEGKSTVASNLALVIAQGVKEQALLIDCDLRNPHKNPLLKGNTPLGLSDYLMDKLEPKDLIVRTQIPKLSILPSGSVTPNAAALLGSEKMRNLMKTLKSQYAHRYIVIDSPPIILTTEPIVLSEMVDGIIVVVLAANTPREVVQRALNNINKEKMLGIVLNQIVAISSAYYSAYYYPEKRT
ncbi:MAG: polysaccharide biosynthesis tyrosine autokinase [Candidatus Hodarchaeota archaeon]